MNILAALAALDPTDDGQWTNDGAPRLEVLATLTGGPAPTRAQLRDMAPAFTRTNPELPGSKRADAVPDAVPDAEPDAVPDAEPDAVPEAVAKRSQAIAQAREELSRIADELQALQVKRDALDKETTVLHRAQEHWSRFVPADGYDATADQAARMAVIAAQNRASAARSAGRSDTGAPIDRAMARKTARGASRPTYPAPVSAES